MTADDELIARALDGGLSPEESAALDDRLKRDLTLARSLMELARTESLLHDAAAAVPAVEIHRGINKGGLVTMAAILLVSATAFWATFTGAFQDPAKPAPARDGDRLRDAWPKLVEAWRALDSCKGDPTSDEYLKAMSRLHGAYEAAGWLDADLEYVPGALKHMFKTRQMESAGVVGGAFPQELQKDGSVLVVRDAGDLTVAFRKLRELKEKGLDDEDNVQDAMANVRTTMKQLGLIAEDTPFWLRRRVVALARAIVLAEAYPQPAKATEEQARKIGALIAELAGGDIESREKAERDLAMMGEPAEPFLREALKHADKEVVGRARKLLGAGHEPWKNVQPVQDPGISGIDVMPAPVAPPPPPAPDRPRK